MSTTIYRSAPPPGVRRLEDLQYAENVCSRLHADDRPNPADDAKKADGSHDIGTEDGMHEIGLRFSSFMMPDDSRVTEAVDASREEGESEPEVDDCGRHRELWADCFEEF